MIQPITTLEYHQYRSGNWQAIQGNAIVERDVSLTVNNEVWFSFMCTPVNLEAMAVGFLYNEGFLESASDVADVRLCASGDNVDVWTHKNLEKPAHWSRTSGCTGGTTSVEDEWTEEGSTDNESDLDKLGEDSIDLSADDQNKDQVNALAPQQLSELIGDLFEGQTLYREAGGIHSSALSDGQRILVSAEDIGRHNTLDKIAGQCLMEGIRVSNGLVISTGRISSEMLQKAARLGAVIVVSRTAASSLAIQMAKRKRITLIGYARRDRFNVYSHPYRILTPDFPKTT